MGKLSTAVKIAKWVKGRKKNEPRVTGEANWYWHVIVDCRGEEYWYSDSFDVTLEEFGIITITWAGIDSPDDIEKSGDVYGRFFDPRGFYRVNAADLD